VRPRDTAAEYVTFPRCAEQTAAYLKYARNLKFDEKPDYDHCRQLWRHILEENNWPEDNIFDWSDMPV
jgi:hypothetical protein